MTLDELVAWALHNGMTVIASAEYQDLCEVAAVGILATAGLEHDLASVSGR